MSPDLGCYGTSNASTPNLDKLAGEGILYKNAFSNSPVCAPSRSTIITGMYASTIGTHHMRSKAIPPVGVKCFTEYLRATGYYCTNNSKTDYNFDVPLAAWDESNKKAHWRNRPAGSPFFSVFNLTVTHESRFHMTDEEFAAETSDLPSHLRHDPAKVTLPPYYPDTPIVRKDWARYQDMISTMDIQVGHILDELKQDGLAEKTIVIFFSDHGRGMPRGKRWLYDSGTHVPLIVRLPGQEGGVIREELVSLIDLAPTMLFLAGVAQPSHLQGRVFLGPNPSQAPNYLFFTRDRMDEKHDMIRSVRGNRYRYIRNFRPELPYTQELAYAEKSPVLQELKRLYQTGDLNPASSFHMQPIKPSEEFYDTLSDPHEINNLTSSSQHQQRIATMRKALDEWMKESGDLGLTPEEELQKRWFPDGQKPQTVAPRISPDSRTASTTTLVEIATSTQGATVVWKTGDSGRWKIYTGPIEVGPTSTTIRARASRAGFENSAVSIAHFN